MMRRAVCVCVASALLLAVAVTARPAAPGPEKAVWFSACASGLRVPSVSEADSFRMPGNAPDAAHLSVQYTLKSGFDATCAAQGFFNDDIATTGWSYLHVESNPRLDSNDQAYAAGWLEGMLTPERNYQSYVNGFAATFANGTCPDKAYAWVDKQNAWIQAQLSANTSSVYWQQVNLVYVQLQGLVDGYAQSGPANPISAREMLMVNLLAEVGDIMLATDYELREAKDVSKMSSIEEVQQAMQFNSHCSALIRLAPDGSDLFAAHTTWSNYANMLRTYKTYRLPLTGSEGVAIQFSSYPGILSSVDDFYSTDSGLIVIETTNDVINMTLYNEVVFESIPTFVRTIVANRMAATGQHWATIYAEHNSGTYNNQWMVVDTKQFTPHQTPRAGTLWIASQMPGRVETVDATPVLIAQQYWSSYNIPYFQDIWYALGYGTLVQQYGSQGEYLWSYKNSFRAEIFARDAPKVQNLADMQRIMQENNWQTDPLSLNNSQLAICARADLSPSGPLNARSAFGAIDAKISSAAMIATESMFVLAKSGPTVEAQPPFVWSTSEWNAEPHLGMPDKFDFDWQEFQVAQTPSAIALQ